MPVIIITILLLLLLLFFGIELGIQTIFIATIIMFLEMQHTFYLSDRS